MKRRITSGNDNNSDGKNQSFNLKSIGYNLPPKTLVIENNIDNRELEDFFKNIRDSKVYKTILTTLNCPEIVKLLESKIINLRAVASFFEDIGRDVITFESILKHPGIIETLGVSKEWGFIDNLSELFVKVGSNIESFKKIMRADIVRLLNENILADPDNDFDYDSFHELWDFLGNLPTGQAEIYTEEGQALNRLNVKTKYTEHQIEIYTRIFNIPGIIDLLSKKNCDEQFVYLENLEDLFASANQDIEVFERIMKTPGVMELLGINKNKEQHVALDVLDNLFTAIGRDVEVFERVMTTPGVMELFKTQQIDLEMLCDFFTGLDQNIEIFERIMKTPGVMELLGLNENKEQHVAPDVLCDLFKAVGSDVEVFERVMTTPGVMELLTTSYLNEPNDSNGLTEPNDFNGLLELLSDMDERRPQRPSLLCEELIEWCQNMTDRNIPLSQEILDNTVRDIIQGNFFEVEEI